MSERRLKGDLVANELAISQRYGVDCQNTLTSALASIQEQSTRIERELADIESQASLPKAAWRKRRWSLEEQSTALMCVYVTAYRLQSCTDLASMCDVLTEILENLIGVSRFAIYLKWGVGSTVGFYSQNALVQHNGEPTEPRLLRGRGPIDPALWHREFFCLDAEEISCHPSGSPIAWVPLLEFGRTIGGMAIFELLPQKYGLKSADIQILEFISKHAALATLPSAKQRQEERNDEKAEAAFARRR